MYSIEKPLNAPILLYRGEGVSEKLSVQVQEKINQFFINSIIPNIDSSYLTQATLQKSTLLIGGGNASKQLNGLGLIGAGHIQEYLKRGNHYLGICAGAYLGTKTLLNAVEARYDREVSFRVSKLPTNWKYVRTITSSFSEVKESRVLYWKGPEFISESYGFNEATLVSYDNQSPAVVFKNGFKTRTLLVSYHPEINISSLDSSYFESDEEKQEILKELEETQFKNDQLTKLLFSKLDFIVK